MTVQAASVLQGRTLTTAVHANRARQARTRSGTVWIHATRAPTTRRAIPAESGANAWRASLRNITVMIMAFTNACALPGRSCKATHANHAVMETVTASGTDRAIASQAGRGMTAVSWKVAMKHLA